MGRAELRLRLVEQRYGLLRRHDSVRGERRGILLPDGGMLGDLGDHQRLRVRGLVLLVVAEAAVADEIDDDVPPELLPVGHREPDRRDRSLGIV